MATIIYEKETGNVLHILPRNIYKQSKFAQNLAEDNQDFILVNEIPEITDKHRQKLMVENAELKLVNLELSPEEEEEIKRLEMYNEINNLKNKLANTDYQAIKFAEGEMSEEDYAVVKIQRRAWRIRINELEDLLYNNNESNDEI